MDKIVDGRLIASVVLGGSISFIIFSVIGDVQLNSISTTAIMVGPGMLLYLLILLVEWIVKKGRDS